MSKLYHAKYKKEFIKENPNTKNLYGWLFNNTFDFEVKYGKDIFDFSKDQILEFYARRDMTLSSLKGQIGFLSTYIDWAIKKGYTFISKNPTKEITINDLEKIAKPENNVLHKDVIYELIGRIDKEQRFQPLKNAQDRLLIYFLFLGICGERANELINLQFKHIKDGYVKLSEIDPNRKDVKIDKFGMELVEMAKRETFYERYQDENKEYYNDHDYDLNESDYVFRKSKVGKYSKDAKITYQALLARLSTMSKYTGQKLTMKRIQKSGMVYVGKLILDRLGKLDRHDPVVVKSIFERYNIEGDRARWKVIREIEKEIKAVYESEEKVKKK